MLPPWMYEYSVEKQESQLRQRSADPSARSLTSSTEVQKHVGQTSVQFPHVRHRSATSAKRGWSRLRGEQFLDARRLEPAPHPLDGVVGHLRRRDTVVARGLAHREEGEDLVPTLGADLDEEPVPAVRELGESEVEAALGPRARAHRRAEARPSGLAAVDGDHEDAFSALRVVALDVTALEEHAVLDRDRMEVARAGAEERERTVRRRLLLDCGRAAVLGSGPPEPHAGGE